MRTTGTCRYFADESIPLELVEQALDAARFAPHGGNLQPVRWLIVRDRALMAQLAEWYLEVWDEYTAELTSGKRGVGAQPPSLHAADDFARAFASLAALVVVCAKSSALYATDGELGRVSVVGGASIYPAVQNFCLACRELGLGTAITTLLCRREPEVRELLGIPENVLTAAHVAVGRPARPWPTRLSRRPVSETAFLDGYGNPLRGT
jgi:nitroreductase